MPDMTFEQALAAVRAGQKAPQKPRKMSFQEALDQELAQQAPGPPSPPPLNQPLPSLEQNATTGAEQALYGSILEPLYSAYDAAKNAVQGNFQPIGELGRLAGAGLTFDTNSPEVQQIEQARAARGVIPQSIQQREQELAQEAALDPTGAGTVGRFLGGAVVSAPPAIAGEVLGGPVAALGVLGAQGLAHPQDIPLDIGLGLATEGIGRGVGKIVSGVTGRAAGRRGLADLEATIKAGKTEAAPTIIEAAQAAPTANPEATQAAKQYMSRLAEAENIADPVEREAAITQAAAEFKSVAPDVAAQVDRDIVAPEAYPPASASTGEVRGKRGTIQGPAPGEYRPDPTLFDPLESLGFYEDPPSLSAIEAEPAPTSQSASISQAAPRANMELSPAPAPISDHPTNIPTALNGASAEAQNFLPVSPQERKVQKAARTIWEGIKSIRSLSFGFDFGTLGRQGLFLVTDPLNTKFASSAVRRGFQALVKEHGEEAVITALRSNRYAQIAEDAGVELSFARGPEEIFADPILEKIPGLGKFYKRTEAGNMLLLDSLRLDTFARMAKIAERKGLPPAELQQAYKGIADFVNTFSGRTYLGNGQIAKLIQGTNGILAAPRLIASRVQMLNPYFYYKLYKTSPLAARLAVYSLGRTVATYVAAAELVNYSGVGHISLDPTDSDFLKFRRGDFRIDLAGGLGPTVRLAIQGGRLIKSLGMAAYDPDQYGKGATYQAERTGRQLVRYGRGHLAPVPGAIIDYVTGSDFLGKPVPRNLSLSNPFVKVLMPLIAKDFYDGVTSGGIGGPVSLPASFFGFNSNTYQDRVMVKTADAAPELDREFQRFGKNFPQIPEPKEAGPKTQQAYKDHVDNYSQLLITYQKALIDSPAYQQADPAKQQAMITTFTNRAKTLATRNGMAAAEKALNPDAIALGADHTIQAARQRALRNAQ